METVDDIYECIGQIIVDHAPPSWSSAVLKAKLTDDTIGLKGSFWCGENKVSFEEILWDEKIEQAIRELYEITSVSVAADNKWNKMEYILQPSGKFKVNFEWDQAWVDEMEQLANE